eukprot:6830121-Pyramimonas_sp.AAC.1
MHTTHQTHNLEKSWSSTLLGTTRWGRVLLHAMRRGELGRWLTLTSFGGVDDQAEQRTVSDWMLPAEERKTRINA